MPYQAKRHEVCPSGPQISARWRHMRRHHGDCTSSCMCRRAELCTLQLLGWPNPRGSRSRAAPAWPKPSHPHVQRTLMCSSSTRGRRCRRSVLMAVVWRLHAVQKNASTPCGTYNVWHAATERTQPQQRAHTGTEARQSGQEVMRHCTLARSTCSPGLRTGQRQLAVKPAPSAHSATCAHLAEQSENTSTSSVAHHVLRFQARSQRAPRTSSFSPAKKASRQCFTLLGSPLLSTERGNEGVPRASGRLSSQNTSYLRGVAPWMNPEYNTLSTHGAECEGCPSIGIGLTHSTRGMV